MLALITIFSCISSFLFGYDLGLIGGALLRIKAYLNISDAVIEVIVGAAKLGAVLGTFIGGACMQYYGRRPSIALDSIFFILGPVIMALAPNAATLVVGRVIVGVGIGIAAVVVPSYLGEIAPSAVRGRVVELFEAMLCVGMLFASLADAAFDSMAGNWRWMVGVPAVGGLVMTCAVFILPESPRWLVVHGRMDEALAVIHKVCTSKALPAGAQSSTMEVEAELLELWDSVEKDKHASVRAFGTLVDEGYQEQNRVYLGTGNSSSRMYSSISSSTNINGTTTHDTKYVVGVPPQLPRIRTNSRDNLVQLNYLENSGDRGGGHGHRDHDDEFDEHDGVRLVDSKENASHVFDSENEIQEEEKSSLESLHEANAGSLSHGQHGDNQKATSRRHVGFWQTLLQMMKSIYVVARGPERAAFRMALLLAFFNQAFASTAIINYAPSVLQHAGVESGAAASLFTALIGGSKLIGVILAFFLVDWIGRRPLLVWGSIGSALSLSICTPADWLDSHWFLTMGMCLFIFSFSISWAGVFWVLLSELFSMSAKSPAVSAATAVLFLTGAIADLVFLTIHSWMGPVAFLCYAIIAIAAGIYVGIAVPETKGCSLKEVQEKVAGKHSIPDDGGGGEFELPVVLHDYR